jgi:hypothetical protein
MVDHHLRIGQVEPVTIKKKSFVPGVGYSFISCHKMFIISAVIPESKGITKSNGSEQRRQIQNRSRAFEGPSEEAVLLAKAVSKY